MQTDSVTPTAEPMRYHGPGWTVNSPTRMVTDPEDGDEYESCDLFQVWAPNDQRQEWMACWTPTIDNRNVSDGFFIRGSSLAEVMLRFDRDDIRPYGDALRAAAAS